MNIKRVVTLLGAGGSLAAWLAAAATSGIRSAPVVPASAAPVDVGGARLAHEIERLHERLRPDVAPQRSRNLFQFAGVPHDASHSAFVPSASAAESLPAVTPPPFRLIGIAEDAGPDGPVRTAILSAAGDVLLVKQGDMATAQYQVTKIGADAIELRDLGDGSLRQLALR